MNARDSRTMRLPELSRPCSACGKPIPSDGRFCPGCGKQATPTPGPKQLSRDAAIEALLKEANLHRVRQDWSGAEARCLDALRLDPNNLAAHSLLGDNYRNQGRLDDAAQWYQLALDLDPSSSSLRVKLKETEEELAKSLVGAVHRSHYGPVPSGTQRLAGLSPSMWLNGLWAALGIFLIAAAILIAGRRRAPSAERDTTVTYTTTSATGPAAANGRKGPGPFVLPTARSKSVQNVNTPIAPPPLHFTAPSQTTVAAPSGTAPARLDAFSDSSLIAVTPVPQGDSATIVVAEPLSPGETADALRRRTVQNGYRQAFATFAANPGYRRIQVTVRFAPTGPAVFVGEIARSALERVTDVGDYVQTFAAFTNPWWSPDLPQERSPESDPSDTTSSGQESGQG